MNSFHTLKELSDKRSMLKSGAAQPDHEGGWGWKDTGGIVADIAAGSNPFTGVPYYGYKAVNNFRKGNILSGLADVGWGAASFIPGAGSLVKGIGTGVMKMFGRGAANVAGHAAANVAGRAAVNAGSRGLLGGIGHVAKEVGKEVIPAVGITAGAEYGDHMLKAPNAPAPVAPKPPQQIRTAADIAAAI